MSSRCCVIVANKHLHICASSMWYSARTNAVLCWKYYCYECAAGSLESLSEPFCRASFWWDSKLWARWNSAEALSAAAVLQSAACQRHAWTAGISCHCWSLWDLFCYEHIAADVLPWLVGWLVGHPGKFDQMAGHMEMPLKSLIWPGSTLYVRWGLHSIRIKTSLSLMWIEP